MPASTSAPARGSSPRGQGRLPAGPVAVGVVVAAWVAAIFWAAGTAVWGRGWLAMGAAAAATGWHRRRVAARRPELWTRRARIGPGTARWDLAWLVIFWPLVLAAPVAGAIQVVRRGEAALGGWSVAAGLVLTAAGAALSARAMVANPFFEGTVRLQPGQQVVEGGPYRVVRHPGYAGLALWVLGPALATGATAAVTLGLAAAGWLAVRTALEDRLLQRGLTGYREYARRVRWRLVPGLW